MAVAVPAQRVALLLLRRADKRQLPHPHSWQCPPRSSGLLHTPELVPLPPIHVSAADKLGVCAGDADHHGRFDNPALAPNAPQRRHQQGRRDLPSRKGRWPGRQHHRPGGCACTCNAGGRPHADRRRLPVLCLPASPWLRAALFERAFTLQLDDASRRGGAHRHPALCMLARHHRHTLALGRALSGNAHVLVCLLVASILDLYLLDEDVPHGGCGVHGRL
mmetsp:Transcript_25482/g.51193  ORF Transcript_25482/g.51193 Transcript_25482/m.51193 type:complete len:220 (-) Transcript_25482:453-1112(-)